MKLITQPLFSTSLQEVPCSTTNPQHPMFGKTIALEYNYSYVVIPSAFCYVIVIVEDEVIFTIHVGMGHGVFLSIIEQRADSDSKEVFRIPFKTSSDINNEFITNITTQIALLLVPQAIYDTNKLIIDTAIRKLLPY